MSNRRNVRKVALALAVVVFAVGSAWSLYRFPIAPGDLHFLPVLGVMLIGVPLTILLNTYEFRLTVEYTGRTIGWRAASEVTIVATAANLLPLPGGTIARVSALKSLGASVLEGVQVNLLAAALWVGVALVYAGSWIHMHGQSLYGGTFLVLGLAIAVPGYFYVARASGSKELAGKFVLSKAALLLIDSIRLLFSLWGLGLAASFAQAASLSLSGVAGSVISIVPAGLGVREAAAGALSSLVGLALSAGFLAAALNRVLGLMVILPLAIFVSRWRNQVVLDGEPK